MKQFQNHAQKVTRSLQVKHQNKPGMLPLLVTGYNGVASNFFLDSY